MKTCITFTVTELSEVWESDPNDIIISVLGVEILQHD